MPFNVKRTVRCDVTWTLRGATGRSTGWRPDAETVTAFIEDTRTRGLGDPLLVVSDGAPGLIKAIETCFPRRPVSAASRTGWATLPRRCRGHLARGEGSHAGRLPGAEPGFRGG
jgi:Transposase, Mutator family